MKNDFNLMMGNRIRKQREYLGYSREKLAEIIGISTGFLHDVEVGAKGMSIANIAKTCEILHVTTDYILLGKEGETDNSPIVEMFKNVDEKYIPCAEELLKVFIKSTNI